MNTSPPSKRAKLDPSQSRSRSSSPSPNDDLEQEHCTICLQSFLDRTIIPVCAHEFCFECILLWSEQSRKCPLCSRSFEDSYLIHHIRSQHDYQKYHFPPSRSSPSLLLTTQSRANVLRNTRRERQWGRRQRQQREEADQLERAIARRRWIYQHHLYAKHIASNPYTRYRPFPTPAQFAASPDLISRMTIFLRRELRVWLNLDVEFLTTYTISLMKSIDIRSESAVKLLSEFLDLDTPYTAGQRHVNAEHFAHEIYSYLRSPYRDLNTYDQTAQYDTPLEISPPQEMERSRRWSAEPSASRRSRSRSGSRYRSLISHCENSAAHSPASRHGTDSSSESRCEDRPRHSRDRSPRGIPPDREDHDSRNGPSGRRHSPLDGIQVVLRNNHPHPEGMSFPEASNSAVLAENQGVNLSAQPHDPRSQKGKTQVKENTVATTAAHKLSAPQSGDSAAALVVGVARLTDGPPGLDYVDKVRGTSGDTSGSSANPPPSRKRSAGLSVHVHPRNRTLSESVQAYLCRPAVPQHSTKKPTVSGGKQPARVSDTGMTGISTTDARPSLLLRLTDGLAADPDMGILPSFWKTSVSLSTPNNTTSERPHSGCHSQSCVSSLNCYSSAVAEHADAITQHGDRLDGGATRSCHFLPSTDDEVPPLGNRSPERLGFPPVPSVKPVTRNANDVALSRALALEGSLMNGRPESVQVRHGELLGQASRFHMETGTTRGTGDQARPSGDKVDNDDTHDLRSISLGSAAALASLDNHERKDGQDHGYSYTNEDIWPGATISADAIAAGPSFFHGGERAMYQAGDVTVGGGLDDASMDESTFSSGSVLNTSTQTRSTPTDVDVLELETRLRMRARLRVRLAAMKGTGGVAGSAGSLSLSGGSGSGSAMDLDSGSPGTSDDSSGTRVWV